MYHFIRRNAKSLKNTVVNCARCRGFVPFDPARRDGDGGGAGGGGKQLSDAIFQPFK